MKVLGLILLTVLICQTVYGDPPNDVPAMYQRLLDRLVQDGFDREVLFKLLVDPRAEYYPAMTTISLQTKETEERYSQFLAPSSVTLAKEFLRRHHTILNQMEKRFHVQKEIVVAILLVESRFGDNIGKWRVVPTLTSMTLTDTSENVEDNFSVLRVVDPELSYEWIESVAKRKALWGYHELKCLLKIVRHEKIDPLEVRGSYAGALGVAQFIPSSYLAFAIKNKSFEDWLLSKESAIFSVGNFLKSHGWRESLSQEKKKRILWQYNHSGPYVETILEVARIIAR